jgi:uncharacterized membrane protein YebE (DUF533 family)
MTNSKNTAVTVNLSQEDAALLRAMVEQAIADGPVDGSMQEARLMAAWARIRAALPRQ